MDLLRLLKELGIGEKMGLVITMAKMTVEQYISWYFEHYGKNPSEKLIKSFCKLNGYVYPLKEELCKKKIIVFECSDPRNKFSEAFEFDADATTEEIEEEFKEWVWNQIGDWFGWEVKG